MSGNIPDGWKTVKLGEVAKRMTSGRTPSTKKLEYYGGNIPWLNTKEIRNCRIYETEKHITEEGLRNSSAKWIEENSVIVAMYGATAGKVAINKIPLTTNQACCNITLCEDTADYYFIYYSLLNSFNELVLLSSGAAQQNLNVGVISNFEILLPPLPEQRAIASILSSLDDKIDLLHRQNKTLEQMAETLFRQWFIEEKEEGWEEKSLSEIANYLNGLACQKYPPENEIEKLPVLKIKDLRVGLSENSDWATSNVPEEYIVENGDVIFSWSGSLLVKIWDGEKCVLNQHLFKVTSEEFPKWFYYFWTKYHLQKFISIAESKATTMGHIKRKDLASSMVLVPSDGELKEMDEKMSPMLDKIILINQQIRTLENLRDTLLPKLMSGAVRVDYESKEQPVEDFIIQHIEGSVKPWPITKPFMEAVLFSGVVGVMSDEKFTPDRVRVTKAEYLAKRYMGMDVLGEYSKMAAGPYDPAIRYKGPEKIAKKNGYVEPVGNTHFKKGPKFQDAEKYLERYGYRPALEWLEQSKLKYMKNKDLELLATVDYAALDLMRQGKSVNVETVIDYIRADKEWSRKLKEKADVFNKEKVKWALKKLKEMFPTTYGG